MISELTTQIDAEFAETFTAVQEQFAHMVEVLFPGGRGRLLLQSRARGRARRRRVEVKPARKLGKKLQLLSGGERVARGARLPHGTRALAAGPFYILDEIEAALDDINIGRFV